MLLDIRALEKWIIPAVFIIGGLLLGIILEKLVIKKITKLSLRTKWEGDDIVVQSIRGMLVLWFFIGSIYGALEYTAIKPDVLHVIHKGLLILVILSVTIALSRVCVGFINVYSRKVGGAFLSTSMFANLTKILVFVIGFLIILQTLGLSITPILTALGVGGLAVALALQDTLSNLFSGIHIIASKQVSPGDYVKLSSGEEGHIIDITWRFTTIKSLPNNMIIVPNSKLASAIVTNYNMKDEVMSFPVQVGVSYDSDLEKVEKVTIEVAEEIMKFVPGGVPEFSPLVRYHTLGDSSIDFNVILRVRNYTDQFPVKHAFIKKLISRYREEGINIPFPVRTVYMK
ncbi:MAG: mechanosensitive ion channel family protein [Deltaproteobacteria bacterium]|nr:mechanosensitive ion channel family protein [Deltaproteobacteria bacterium]